MLERARLLKIMENMFKVQGDKVSKILVPFGIQEDF